jgi:hypothetical protein
MGHSLAWAAASPAREDRRFVTANCRPDDECGLITRGELLMVRGPSAELLDGLPLIDHHCHGVLAPTVEGRPAPPLDRAAFEAQLNEGAVAGPGRSYADSLLGLALRRWCPPVLDLPAHTPLDAYLERRAELGVADVSRRLLGAAGIGEFVVDTGYSPAGITPPDDLAALAGAALGGGTVPETRAYEIVRLETLAEGVAATGVTASGFADAVRNELARRRREPAAAGGVVGAKTIAAYRVGLRLPGPAPAPGAVTSAAGRWLGQLARTPGVEPRCADPVLSRFLIQCALEDGLPVQVHCGYGDNDLDLDGADPVNLTAMLRATEPLGTPILLLHDYPFHRQAGYLAQVFTHVSTDLGLATHNLGSRSAAVLAEALELVPFGDFLFSSDAFGLPELYLLGALLFRRGLGQFLDDGIAADEWTVADAEGVVRAIASENARRVYGLPDPATVEPASIEPASGERA